MNEKNIRWEVSTDFWKVESTQFTLLDLESRGNCNRRHHRWKHQRKANQLLQETKKPEGLGRTVYGRQGWDGAWGKGSRHQGFSTQHLFLTQPLTCLPFLLPGRMLSPSLSVMVWPWDSEEDMGIESEKHGANTGK